METIEIAHNNKNNLTKKLIEVLPEYLPDFNFQLKESPEIKHNHHYGFLLPVESKLDQFFNITESKRLFLVDKMVIGTNNLWGNYVIEPATSYFRRENNKKVFVISNHKLEEDISRIAKLASHEILEIFYLENAGRKNHHCEDHSCIMYQTRGNVDFYDVKNEDNFYKHFKKEIDDIEGLCKKHDSLLKKILTN